MALKDWTSCRVTKGVTNRPLQRRNSEHPSISTVFHHTSGKLTRNRRKLRSRHEHSYFPALKTTISQPEQAVVIVFLHLVSCHSWDYPDLACSGCGILVFD
uniref:(northern house mosquito) hypothetical protein n=1 Tax=Culex pipiens TaxID=7175 RepID=A0A8D8G476_CULPI